MREIHEQHGEIFDIELCYEYLGGKQRDCCMFQYPAGKQCWEGEGTLCSSHGVAFIFGRGVEKIDVCQICIYFTAVHSGRAR